MKTSNGKIVSTDSILILSCILNWRPKKALGKTALSQMTKWEYKP